MKFYIIIALALTEYQQSWSSQVELKLENHVVELTEGNPERLTCHISHQNQNCSVLYKRFYWEAEGRKPRLTQRIADRGCSVSFIIYNSSSADAGRYSCIVITRDNLEVKKQLRLFVLKSGQSKTCPFTQTKCRTSGHCIFQRYRCDNYNDCRDGSDEMQCDKDKCANMFICNNSRCIDKSQQCNRINNCGDSSDEDERCNVASSEAPPPTEDDHFDWLKTTVYTIIGCTVAVVIFISFIVIVVFRVKMKRLRARRIARALERHRQHQGSSGQSRNPEQDPFLSAIGPNSHYGNIIVNVNNGVQYVPTGDFTAFVDSPPPYHEVISSDRENSPPPPYSTIDRTPRQKPTSGEMMETGTNTSSCDLRGTHPPAVDMTSIEEGGSDLLGACSPQIRNSHSDINPPSYSGSSLDLVGPQESGSSPVPTSSSSNPSNRTDSVPPSAQDTNLPTSDQQPRLLQSQQSNSSTSSLRPARLAVQGGKIVLSADEEEAASSTNQLSSGLESSRPRQCHLEVKEGQIVLTDLTRGEHGVQSPLNPEGVVRGSGELEVRDGQIIFRPKET